MKIENNILKYYLRNVLFITGTSYAGKSTMVSMLAKKYNLIHCNENFHTAMPSEMLTLNHQPNMSYFETKKDWQEFLNRTPEIYNNWIQGVSKECTEIEIIELIHRSQGRKVIADTNIPLKELAQLADYNQIAIMLAKDPAKTMLNFKACLATSNSKERYDEFAKSGFFTMVRKDAESDTRQEVMQMLAGHFGLINDGNILISTEHLYIRPFKKSDFEQFKELLVLYPGWFMQKNNVSNFFEWHLSNYKAMDVKHGYVCFGVFEKETRKLIGNIGINEHDDLHLPELSYGILESYRGNGYAKEAAKAMLCWAKYYFNISSLIGTAAVNNIASRKVLEFCGFILQEVKNLKIHITNEYCDFAVYQYDF